MKQYVIVGGGVASVGCIEGIRSVDKTSPIVLVAGEGVPTYCRPLISYYLEGKTDLERMKYRPDDFYDKMGCRLLYGTADKIDTESRQVYVDGAPIDYAELCLSTGSTPFVPPFAGLDTVPIKTGFMTQKDALYLDSVLSPASRVLIVGAGLIGLKCAEGIADRVAKVTVCDLADRVLSSILDAPCAVRMQRVQEAHGVEFHLQNSVSRFDGTTATLQDGTHIDFDVLVTAVGVRANVGLVKGIADVDRGVLADTKQATSAPHIYAAGDCCQGYDASIDGGRVVAILPNAYLQGYTAGVNMAGGDKVFDKGMPLNAIGFFGYHALTAGAYRGEMTEIISGDDVKRLFIENGRLVGFMLLGDIQRAGILTALVRNKTPLEEKTLEILKNTPTLESIGAQKRKEILGGVV
jgi:NAD(P)H-nitrite reductase large subunit